MIPGNSDDRFGLNGAPEVQQAQRIQFGNPLKLYAVMLGLRAVIALLDIVQGPGRWMSRATPSELGWAGFAVSALQVPVLAWGFWVVLRGRQTEGQRTMLASIAFVLAVLLDITSRTVSDIAQGRPLDTVNATLTGLSLLACGAVGVGFFMTQRKKAAHDA